MDLTVEERLAEARAALHELLIGRRVQEIRTATETVRYGPGDEAQLRAYIRDLEIEAGQAARRSAIGARFR